MLKAIFLTALIIALVIAVFYAIARLIFEFDWKGRRSKSVIEKRHKELFKDLL